ncbi:hypothetical protein IEO21_08957 [Rhodonia placenta]|uniref:Six-hairpin glycosidase n=1 Tax=Rhodonia placenta TaxID=104341 RepID=A0A8H7NV93_9APHY|nr:hypothetical protein IEO21_08957 [Postia placenta]
MPPLSRVVILLALAAASARAQNLTDAQVQAVKDELWLGAQQTWELGTEGEALTEYDAPSLSVFANASLPPSPPYNLTALAPVLQIARNVVGSRSNSSQPQPLWNVSGGAAGDPVSIGQAVLLANWTGAPEPYPGVDSAVTYARAAAEQLEYTLQVVPRTTNGAISHRIEQVQLWADSVYMVPPFLAYYGVVMGNQSLLSEAYTQIKLYRGYLYDSKASLWQHIMLGENDDPGFWSTGNGWAAAGMLRVLATIKNSPWASDMKGEMNDLTSWVREIQDGMYPHLQPNVSLFHNYANETASFLDASSTALLAATVYRLALLAGVHTHLPLAEQCRRALSGAGAPDVWGTGNGAGPASTASFASASASGSASARSNGTAASSTPYNASSPTSTASASASTATAPSISVSVSSYYPAAPAASAGAGLAHFSPEMWLTPVVDPYDWSVQGGSSPEGQAFVVEMYAAWRDWVEAGAPGASAARRLGVSAGGCGWWVWVAVGAAGVVMGWGVGV